jgi:transposase
MFFGDESYFNLSPEVPYGWQKIGEYIKIVPKRKKTIKIFGLLSRESEELHTYEAKKNINSQFIIDSIDEFATKIRKKTVIVLDNASTHTSNLMQEKIKIWKEQDIEIFFLPKYSPHLNLIETCWRKMKQEWIEPQDYENQLTLETAIQNIFDNYGKKFNINFSEFTNIELLLKSG